MSDLKQNLNPSATTPDFGQIVERPRSSLAKDIFLVSLKVLGVLLILACLAGGILAIVYYKNVQQAYTLSMAAKADLEEAVHKITNREFVESAGLIKKANGEMTEAQTLLNKIILVRHLPYIGRQIKAVDQVLVAGTKLTHSGEKVVLLIDNIVAPLANESITYATISVRQKIEILDKIVKSESLLLEVQQDIDAATAAIDSIPTTGLIAPLREKIEPIKEIMPPIKQLIDQSLPLLSALPKIAGFEGEKNYLFLLQNNSELRPTGGFLGTYGILKMKNGEMVSFDTDNIYNLDRSSQSIIKEPTPWPIEKYLEQKEWAMRDINWSPDFPTTAQKALEMYKKENEVLISLRKSGQKIIGEKGVELTDILPYEENIYSVIAMTPEILGGLLKLTGPIVAGEMVFTDSNYQDQLELMVGKLYQELDIPIAERKGIIKKLADQISVKLMTLPTSKLPEVLSIGFQALAQKQVLFYSQDEVLQKIILERNWGGAIRDTNGDYVFVVDSNMASLKTDQFVDRTINHSLSWQGSDLIGKVSITYKNNADFTWKSSRLRTYSRVYVPLDSILLQSSGAMEDDKIKDPNHQPGQVEVSQEANKTYFGAFISIEPHESGVLSFEYKLPERIKDQLKKGGYNLLVQKQPGVLPDLTLTLNFDKTIKSASPAEPENEWFNTSYNYKTILNSDKQFFVIFK